VITRAYESARTAHRDQTRSSGESYINHPLAVARIVAELGLDETTIAAALLHDAVEDTELTIEQVQHEFGAEVGSIVDGVTKLDRLQFDSREAQQAATMRKMLVAMARDLRVLIIKLADRLHNMRTIAAMPADKQRRIAQETMDIYAPLAHRLGMQELKQQLEDLSFAALFPKRYSELDNLVFTRTPERDVYLASMIAEIQSRLNSLRITGEVTGRGKHMWSIYEKMVQRGKEFDEIFDLVAVRIIVDSVKDCYGALGCIHGQWKPVVGRFKDPGTCTIVLSGVLPHIGRTRKAQGAKLTGLIELSIGRPILMTQPSSLKTSGQTSTKTNCLFLLRKVGSSHCLSVAPRWTLPMPFTPRSVISVPEQKSMVD